ncbi:MAG: hypothetical protein ACD_22C00100G0021 [uncultured bacterium]|nr:MAG: hypothetical protein ACD_22C00100G0021 [uncultured bacterium]
MSRFSKILTVIFVVLPLVVFLFVATTRKLHSKSEVVSGLAEFFGDNTKLAYERTKIDTYDPDLGWQFGEVFGTYNEPTIIGSSAVLVDINTGKILYEKNPTEKRKIASLTKIMTAVVALEHEKLDTKMSVSATSANIGENVMGLTEGEIYTMEDLLYGLILNSGNDAAYTIAENVAGSSDKFVEWMNFKAKELALKNTYFADPSGLDDDTYSTVEDLARLTRYALKNPEFREIVKTFEYEIFSDETHKYIYMQNQTNLLTTYPGVFGVKTGYTEEAGLCLVTFASNNNHDVVGVVLNSYDRKGDMILMLDHAFGTLGVVTDHPALTF